jgi:hypothetical protein
MMLEPRGEHRRRPVTGEGDLVDDESPTHGVASLPIAEDLYTGVGSVALVVAHRVLVRADAQLCNSLRWPEPGLQKVPVLVDRERDPVAARAWRQRGERQLLITDHVRACLAVEEGTGNGRPQRRVGCHGGECCDGGGKQHEHRDDCPPERDT